MELNSFSWLIITLELCLFATMLISTTAYMTYRRFAILRVRKEADELEMPWGKPLPFESPDDIPRTFVQYGFRSSLLGTIMVYQWVAIPVIGYVLLLSLVYLTYTVGEGFYFPPSAAYWQNLFGGWNGIMVPWQILFLFVHISAGFVAHFRSALYARSLLPVVNMRDATHLVIDEDVLVNPENTHDPEEKKKGKVWFVRPAMEALGERYRKARSRQVVHIQVVKRHATAGQVRYENEETTETTEESESDEAPLTGHQRHALLPAKGKTRVIEYTCVRYHYDEEADAFLPSGSHEPSASQLHARLQQGGLTHEEAYAALATCGPNEIKVRVPTAREALVEEFSYFANIFSSMGIMNNFVDSFILGGSIALAMTLFSGIQKALFIVRPSLLKVSEMAEMRQDCQVLRNGVWKQVDIAEIALGDIVKVEDGHDVKLPCDGLIVEGSVVVNESMLTGEPMPVAKAPVEKGEKAEVSAKLNKVYAGTLVLESTGPHGGKAVMVATSIGASTTRGQMVRMVLFPSDVRFKYVDQIPIVYVGMFFYACFIVSILLRYSNMGSPVVNLFQLIGTVTSCLNPMLPVSIVMGQSISATRLADDKGEYKIKCLQPGRIPMAGKISTMVFDKTGTITKGTMDFVAVISAVAGRFGRKVQFDASDPESQGNRQKIATPSMVPQVLQYALATCHTVKQLKDGRLVGNQVECSMVRTSGWTRQGQQMVSPTKEALTIVRELEFDHHRMTSGSVVRNSAGRLMVFIKGSYEKIQQIAERASIPADYEKITTDCAKDNYYTLGISYKELPATTTEQQLTNWTRDEFEANLQVCGLLLFRNELKADSGEAIAMLRAGAIRSVMCTGDNELTGIAVARKCGIVHTSRCLKGDIIGGKLVWTDPDQDLTKPVDLQADESSQLAVTFTAWRHLLEHEELLSQIWPRLVVFGRMKPNDKINVVKFFQRQGLIVGMAGDGGNDCGGLRAAHAGIALSDAEASLVSPFSTGRLGLGDAHDDISLTTVPDLVREGRACLSSNLSTFQYFMVYGLTITAVRTTVVVNYAQTMGEWVWITVALICNILMVYFMTRSEAQPTLANYRPTGSLFNIKSLAGIFFPYLTCVGGFLLSSYILWGQPWYDSVNPTKELHVRPKHWMKKADNYDIPIAVMFMLTHLGTTAYCRTYGGDFRKTVLRNTGLNALYLVLVSLVVFLCFTTPNQFSCIFRVNCDAEASMAAYGIPIMSKISFGGTGGCFFGPQVKYWQQEAARQNITEWDVDGKTMSGYWLPEPPLCLPPDSVLEKIPVMSSTITTGKGMVVEPCEGPNNCYPMNFKVTLFSILFSYVLLNHVFSSCVLMGPIAALIRAKTKAPEKYAFINEESTVDGSEGQDSDSELSHEGCMA